MTAAELRKIREQLDLTQGELAWRAGIKRNSVTRHEAGTLEIRPALGILYRLLGHLADEAIPLIEAEVGKFRYSPPQFRRRRRRLRLKRKTQ